MESAYPLTKGTDSTAGLAGSTNIFAHPHPQSAARAERRPLPPKSILPCIHSPTQILHIRKPNRFQDQTGLTTPVPAAAITDHLLPLPVIHRIRLHLLDFSQWQQYPADIESLMLKWLPDIQ